MKKQKYIFPILSALSVFLVYIFVRKITEMQTIADKMGVLSDGFFAAAVLVGGIGLLSFAGKHGTFDMLSYGTKSFLGNFIPTVRHNLPRTFYDYKKEKDEKGRAWLKECALVGAISLALGVLALILYFVL